MVPPPPPANKNFKRPYVPQWGKEEGRSWGECGGKDCKERGAFCKVSRQLKVDFKLPAFTFVFELPV